MHVVCITRSQLRQHMANILSGKCTSTGDDGLRGKPRASCPCCLRFGTTWFCPTMTAAAIFRSSSSSQYGASSQLNYWRLPAMMVASCAFEHVTTCARLRVGLNFDRKVTDRDDLKFVVISTASECSVRRSNHTKVALDMLKYFIVHGIFLQV
jgi:hypothetical protein